MSVSTHRPSVRFVVPRDVRGLQLRIGVASMSAFLLLLAGADAWSNGSDVGALLGITSSVAFSVLAWISWRRCQAGPPLRLDEEGIHVDDGLGATWQVCWSRVRGVELERHGWRRSVVLEVDTPSDDRRVIPRGCGGDLPPEWLAGLIDTLRDRALRRRPQAASSDSASRESGESSPRSNAVDP